MLPRDRILQRAKIAYRVDLTLTGMMAGAVFTLLVLWKLFDVPIDNTPFWAVLMAGMLLYPWITDPVTRLICWKLDLTNLPTSPPEPES